MPREHRSRATLLGASLLAVLVIALPLLRGGVGWRAQLLAVLLAPAALWLAAGRDERLPLAALPLAGVLLVMALQALPWPAALHRLVPANQEIFEVSLTPLGLYPSARAPSLDPPATAREFAKAAAGLAAFCAAWLAGAGRRRRAVLVAGLAAAGPVTAAITLGGAVLGEPLLAPHFPFVNPNHLAGFLCLGSFVTLGVALRSRGQGRLLWLLAFVATAVVLLTTLSRGGIAAFLVGLAVFGLLGQRRDQAEPASTGRLLAAGGVTAALFLAGFVALDPIMAELRTLQGHVEETKLALLAPALSMAREHPLLGIGRGAFETAFPTYKTDLANVTFTHLENEWVQPLVELGAPAGLLLLGTLAVVWIGAARRRDLSWREVGLLAGTAALAAHEAVDFSLELVGVSIPFMAALGLAASGSGARAVGPWTSRAVAAGLGVAGLAGLLTWRAHDGDRALRALATETEPGAVVAAARTAVSRRPADYLPHAIAGQRLVEADHCASALPWLTRAMLLNPTAPDPHLFTARCLAAGGQGPMARREYRLALSYGRWPAFYEAAARYPDLEQLLEVIPDEPYFMLGLGEFLLPKRPEEAAEVYRRIMEEFGDERAIVPLGRAKRALGAPEEALALARHRTAAKPDDTAAWLLAAGALADQGNEEGAAAEARAGLEANPGALNLQLFLVERAMVGRRFAEARRLADELTARTPEEVATQQLLAARALAAQGRLAEAVERARSAAAAQPTVPGPLLAIASYCEQAGWYDDGIAALERAAALPGQVTGGFSEAIARLRTAKAEREIRQAQERLQR